MSLKILDNIGCDWPVCVMCLRSPSPLYLKYNCLHQFDNCIDALNPETCPVPGCGKQRLDFWRSFSRPLKATVQEAVSLVSTYFCCAKHSRPSICRIVDSQSPIGPRAHCIDCLKEKKVDFIEDDFSNQGLQLDISRLVRGYLGLAAVSEGSRKCLNFQAKIDESIMAELIDFLGGSLKVWADGTQNWGLANSASHRWIVANRFLDYWGRMLCRTAETAFTFSEGAVVYKMAEVVFESDELESGPTVPTFEEFEISGGRTPLHQIFLANWPFLRGHPPKPDFPNGRSTRNRRCPKLAAQCHSLREGRKRSVCRRLITSSEILGHGDIQLVEKLFGWVSGSRLLVRIQDETDSSRKFQKAAQGQSSTLLLIKGTDFRIGYFLEFPWDPWGGHSGKGSFAFSLADGIKHFWTGGFVPAGYCMTECSGPSLGGPLKSSRKGSFQRSSGPHRYPQSRRRNPSTGRSGIPRHSFSPVRT